MLTRLPASRVARRRKSPMPAVLRHDWTREEILALFKRLQQEDHTVVLITHDPDVAHHCDRVFTMRDGRLAEEARA